MRPWRIVHQRDIRLAPGDQQLTVRYENQSLANLSCHGNNDSSSTSRSSSIRALPAAAKQTTTVELSEPYSAAVTAALFLFPRTRNGWFRPRTFYVQAGTRIMVDMVAHPSVQLFVILFFSYGATTRKKTQQTPRHHDRIDLSIDRLINGWIQQRQTIN